MKQSTFPVRRLPGLLLALSTVLLAALLAWQCMDLYQLGNAPANLTETGLYKTPVFSRALVSQRLADVAWAFWLWLGTLVLAVAVQETPRRSLVSPVEDRLRVILARTEATPAMQAEARRRRWMRIGCLTVCAASAAGVLIYLLRPDSFASRDMEPVMGAMLLHVLPWTALGLGALIVGETLCIRSMQRELDAAREAPRRRPDPPVEPSTRARSIGRTVLYLLAAALIAAGVLNGGMRDVLIKAINICTECIGLG